SITSSSTPSSSTPSASTTSSSTTSSSTTATETPDEVDVLLATLSPEQKIGQLLMPVLFGTDANNVGPAEAAANRALGGAATPAELVAANHLGGVLYLGTNIVNTSQVDALSAGLQAVAPPGVGLLIAVDQEGGRVNRITEGVTVFPSARSLSGDAEAVRAAANTTGTELSALGINVVLAPVADLTDGGGVIGNRSYGSDPSVSAAMVVAAVEGLTTAGVASAVKHWPGHGATATDGHRSLPILDVDVATWRARELVPFEAAIKEGVDIVLVGHLAIPSLDPSGAPATVSPVLLDELLRQEMGFDGVVMTDALDMGAVGSYSRGELVVQAVLAGVDILLVTPDLAAARAGLLAALDDGRLTPERLDASVERVLRLKLRLGLLG
ncbi:MAG: beta-N-acetylhexosaminidase, partial [Acidimicrobiales bacterium]